MARQKPLGRGLSALFDDSQRQYAGSQQGQAAADGGGPPRMMAVGALRSGIAQPRTAFDPEALAELADSIRAHGVLQPLLVRPLASDPDHFEIIAGERRWRAAQMANLHEVPVLVRSLGDGEALEVALIENLQRQDLSPLEEAEGLSRLMEEFQHTQEDVARVIGKSRSHVANMLRLLKLPPLVRDALNQGRITMGHARALLGVPEESQAALLLDRASAEGWSVRQMERAVQEATNRPRRERTDAPDPAGHRPGPASSGLDQTGDGSSSPRWDPPAGGASPAFGGHGGSPDTEAGKDPEVVAMEAELCRMLGLRVVLTPRGEAGTLTLHYRSLEQLDDLLLRLSDHA